MEFRDALKQLRRELGITQTELAHALHVNVATVSRWELGRNRPNRSITVALQELVKGSAASETCIRNLGCAIEDTAKEKLKGTHDDLYVVEHASLSQLVEDATYPIYVCDMETDALLYVNHRAEEMIGESFESCKGNKCYVRLMHRDTPCPFCHRNELVKEEFKSFDAVRPLDGMVYRVQGKLIQWNGRKAQVRYIVDRHEFENTSDIVEINSQLTAQRNQMTKMINAAPGGIAVIEVDSRDIAGSLHTTYYNDSFYSFSGYNREEYDKLLRGNEMHFVFEEDVPILLAATAQICDSEMGRAVDSTVRCHTKDGGYRWLLLTGQLVAKRGTVCVINIVLVDITKRKDAEDRQRISEEMLRIAAETDNRALIIYDVKANTCRVESRNLYSAKYGEVLEDVPQSLIDVGIVAPESVVDLCAMFKQIRDGEQKASASMQLRTGSNEYQWFACNATVVFDADAQPDHAVLVFHNITDQRVKEAVFKKWLHSISSRPEETYTLFRCNLSKDASLDEQDGELLKIKFGSEPMPFNARTKQYAERYVYPDDRDRYVSLLDSNNLLAMYYSGERVATLAYRETGDNGEVLWRQLTVEMVEYLNSTDVQAFLMYEDIDEKKKNELKEKEMAETDPLTGVLNRVAFSGKVDAMIDMEPTLQSALLMMDMDGFKLLNDTFGHAAGDQALMDVTAVLRSLIREGDLVCRLGGDEFLIWLRGIPYDAVIGKMAQQICEQVRKAFSLEVQISASIGVAVYPRDGHDFDTLYHHADKALYEVKQTGKDHYAFFSSDGNAAQPEDAALTTEARPEVRQETKAKRRMLIVDDSAETRILLEGLFKDDYQIEMAKNGTEAMIRLRHFGSAISIVLLDLFMPEPDGFEILKRIKNNVELRAMPVIIVSGSDDHKTLLKAIECGAADFVTKPIDRDLIRTRVKSAVSKAENERLRAQNSYLQLQRDEEIKFHTVLESTGTVVIEYNWRNHVFIYDNTISNYIAGTYNHRGLWAVFLADMVAESADVQSLQEMMLSLANDREQSKATKLIMLKTPSKVKHWFRMNVYKQEDTFGLAEKMIITFNDVHEEVLANERLRFQATRDSLTGLYNRSGFIERATELIAGKEPGYYVIACIDIEKFKVINDQYGTKKGDEILCRFADVLRKLCREKDSACCRITADNFAALYPRRLIGTARLASVHSDVETLDDSLPPLKIYVGRYIIDDKALAISAAYDRAAIAKGTVKGRYDNYIATYDESMRTELLRQQRIIGQMNAALAGGQFEVWLQPQYNHKCGTLSGVEALARWRHPQDGIISPAEFIPVFEKTGFVYELDKFVWEQSCKFLRRWLDKGWSPVPVSVNISRYDVFREDLIPVISKLVETYGLPVELLRLEITESAFVESSEQIIRVVRQFIERGFTVEIDDFGSGYSSLNTLKDVPAQVLKMDMRFLENDRNSQRGGSIIESLVRMAKWLGMEIVAEGVETIEQADYLQSIGCENVQGFLYAKPMPADEYESLLVSTGKEPKQSGVKALENWNNNAFWDPKSMETLVFNSYVGGASIFEYHNGTTEILRRNKEYDRIFSGKFAYDAASSTADAFAFFEAGQKATLITCMQHAIESKTAASCEVCLTGRDNEKKYLRGTFRLIAQTGERSLLYAVIVDVTEQREAQIKEQNLSVQMKTIMANLHGGITAAIFHDEDDVEIIFSNDGFYALYGYTKQQMESEVPNVLDLMLPEDRERTMETVARIVRERGSETYEYRCRKRDGSIMWTQCTNSVISIAGVGDTVLLAVTNDITQLRAMEHRIIETSDRLSAVMNHAGNGITALALRGDQPQFVFMNERFFEIVGYTKEAYEKTTAGDMLAIVHPEDRERMRDIITRTNREGGSIEAEYRVIQASGNVVWVKSVITISGLAGIDVPVQISVFSDITAEKNANDQLRFLNDSAHDILAQPNSEQAVRDTLKKLTAYFDADRGYVVELDYSKMISENTYEVCADGVQSELPNLQAVPFSRSDFWFATLMQNKHFFIGDVNSMDDGQAEMRRMLSAQGVRAIIVAPLWRDGTLIGFVGVDNPKKAVNQTERLTALADYIAILLTRRDLTAQLTSEQQMSLDLMNGIPGGFVRMKLSAAGKFIPVYINNGFLRMVGMTKEELHEVYGGDVLAGVAPEDRHIVEEAGRRMLAEGAAVSERFRVRHGSGKDIWLIFSGSTTKDYNGAVFLDVYYTDVTERMTEEQKRKDLLDNLPTGAALYEYDGKDLLVIHINKSYWELVGRKPVDYSAASVLNVVYEEDRESILQEAASAIGQKRNVDVTVRILCGEGEYRPFRIQANFTREANGRYLFFVSYIPISAQTMSMQQMIPFIFTAMMESSTDIAFAKDKDFRYLCCSHTYARLLGLADEKAVVGKTDYELFNKKIADHVRASDVGLVAGGKPIIDRVETIPAENGLPCYLRISKYLLRDTGGSVIGIYGIGRDITQRQETSDQLKLLTNTIPGGLATFACSAQGYRLEYFNDGFVALFGSTRDEMQMPMTALMNHICDEDRAMVNDRIQTLLKDGTPIDCIYRIRTDSGVTKWVSHKAIIANRIGGTAIINAVFLDVTEEQEEKERLRVSEELNRLAIEHSGNIITRFDVQKRTLTLPDTFSPIFALPHVLYNMPREQIALGRVSPETADVYTELFESIVRGNAAGSATYQQNSTKGWRWLEAQYTTVFSSSGKPVSAVISFTDITEKLEKEVVYNKWQQSLNERPESSYALFRCNLSRGTSFDSWEGKLLTVDFSGAEQTFDARTAEYVAQCVYKDDRERYAAFMNSDAMLAAYYRGHRSDRIEYREQLQDGTVRWLRLSVDLVEYPNSKDIEVYLMYEDIDKQKKTDLMTLERAETDPLTGILNRATFILKMEEILHASKPGEKHALLMLDVDNFKHVNDTLGHGAGDQVLRDLTERINSILRRNDLIGRLGGDEFFVFLKDVPDEDAVAAKARQICALTIYAQGSDIPVTASIGIAMIPKDGESFDALYKRVDSALYREKKRGKKGFQFCSRPEDAPRTGKKGV